ncbi:MAG TPA: TIM barrel protein [Candidatus Sulfomarinibacteraceae bacterium]|nr:TIM barrel protein [Candidatus Sulfomarinibacteraceae bacterium]
MRLAVSSWSWHDDYYAGRWSLVDLPASAAEAGLSHIECNDFMLPPPRLSRLRRPLLSLLPGTPPELWRYSRASVAKVAQRAREMGVTVLAWTVNSDFTVPAHHWPLQQIYLRRGVAAARQLEAQLLRVNLGGDPQTPAARDPLIARRLARFVQFSQEWYPGLVVTVENHWGVSSDLGRHLQIVRDVKRQLPEAICDRFGCCFDPHNIPEEERERWWPGLAAAANHYHFKTTAFDEETGEETELPQAQLLSLLAEAQYEGDAAIEFQGDGDALENVRRSRALFERLQGG